MWAQHLKPLHHQGTITGFVLITPQGPSEPVCGIFEEQCPEGRVSAAVQALIKPFYQATDGPTTHLLNGRKLQIIHQTDSCYVAISQQRQLGLIALNLPTGVLLASFDRSIRPTAALLAVQTAVGALHSPQQFEHSKQLAVAAACRPMPVAQCS